MLNLFLSFSIRGDGRGGGGGGGGGRGVGSGRCFRALIFLHSGCGPVFLFSYNTICTIEFILF